MMVFGRKSIKLSLEEETTKTAIMVDDLSRNDNWFDANKIKDWILSEPDISDMDLRPYYYACKEKIDYFAVNRPSKSRQ